MAQQQQSSLAKKLGGRLATANAECSGKPLDLGRQRLPGGIRNGIAKLQTMVWKTQEKDDGKVPKGELYFAASAVVVSPVEHDGIKVQGQQTFFQIPLCDVPAKGLRKASSFEDNWNKFRSLIEALGISPCKETAQTDPTGLKTEAYFIAAMQSLTSPSRPPVYISFSTRDWTPPPSTLQPKPETMTLEDWHGPAKYDGTVDPAGGITQMPPAPPTSYSTPPTDNGAFVEPPQGRVEYPSLMDEVQHLVATVMDNPECDTEESNQAANRLQDLALEAGWDADQITNATWDELGSMILNPSSSAESNGEGDVVPTIGSRWKFSRRDKAGKKLTNSKGEEFPPLVVEVASIDEAARTCTLRNVADGKEVTDVRSKKPTVVNLDWLEQ